MTRRCCQHQNHLLLMEIQLVQVQQNLYKKQVKQKTKKSFNFFKIIDKLIYNRYLFARQHCHKQSLLQSSLYHTWFLRVRLVQSYLFANKKNNLKLKMEFNVQNRNTIWFQFFLCAWRHWRIIRYSGCWSRPIYVSIF